MKQQKIYSIIIGLVAYIIISHIFHVISVPLKSGPVKY